MNWAGTYGFTNTKEDTMWIKEVQVNKMHGGTRVLLVGVGKNRARRARIIWRHWEEIWPLFTACKKRCMTSPAYVKTTANGWTWHR